MTEIRRLLELGLPIRQARRTAGLTQQELSKRAHVSRRWLIAVENGDAQAPDTAKIFDTLRALGLSMFIAPTPPSVPPKNRDAAAALEIMDNM